MSDYIVLDNTQAIDNTGGFSRTFGGTGSNSNPSLTYTNNYYQWRASFNAEYNAPGCTDTPNIFLNDPKLLTKYKTIEIHYYRTQYSQRSYGSQGMRVKFYSSADADLGTVFDSYIKSSGTKTEEQTVEVEKPKNATKIKVQVGANNDNNDSSTTCRIYSIILKHKKGTKLGDTDCEVFLGEEEVGNIYLGQTET